MQHLILLHGAVGSSKQLEPLAQKLKNKFTVHLVNFPGHGGRPFPVSDFSIGLFAGDVLSYMQQNNIAQACIFGYSMGGYVAMYLAKHYPEKVSRIVTLATKFHWDESTAAKEIKMLDPGIIQQKVPAFAQQLADLHSPSGWKKLMEKTVELLSALGSNNTLKTEDYPTISTPSLLLLGDRDKMVTLDETVAVYKRLPNAQLGILPGTPHPVEQVNIQALVFFIRQYFNQ